jgi:hypothetical protein
VLSIWEGTTNVLSLDVLRALEKTDALRPFLEHSREQLAAIRGDTLAASATRVRDSLGAIERLAERLGNEGREFAESHARAFSYALARTTAGLLLLQYADSDAARTDPFAIIAATRWCDVDRGLWAGSRE